MNRRGPGTWVNLGSDRRDHSGLPGLERSEAPEKHGAEDVGLVIGMDEAGYGPNLGPLVISATVWEVPDACRSADLRELLSDAVCDTASRDNERVCMDDSKRVYSPGGGLSGLELGVLSALRLTGHRPQTFHDLCRGLSGGLPCDASEEFWLNGRNRSLPVDVRPAVLDDVSGRLRRECQRARVRLRAIRSDIVPTRRFNRMLHECGSKGLGLSRTSLRLLRELWDPGSEESVSVVADKHGGRNRYDELLDDIVDGHMIFRVEEGRQLSVYRIRQTEIRFQTRAESHLAVALASMVSKYVREIAMDLFNEFWLEHVPHIQPTRGYPVDARRFRQDISVVQRELGIPDEALWRER